MLGIDTNVMNLIQVGVDFLSHLDTNIKDGYECYEFDICVGLIVYLIRIEMLGIDTNVMNLIYVGFDCLSHLDTNVGIDTNVMNLIQVGVDFLSHLDTNVKDGYKCNEFDIGWV